MKETLQYTVTSLYDRQIEEYHNQLARIKDLKEHGLISDFERIDHQQEVFEKLHEVYNKIEGFKECCELFGYTIEGDFTGHTVIEKG